jgi:hypothetical protein
MKKKVQTKEEPSIQEYNEKKEEKELMVEKLKRKGIGVVFQNNTPMFNVKSKDDIKLVEESMRPFGSFGYRY